MCMEAKCPINPNTRRRRMVAQPASTPTLMTPMQASLRFVRLVITLSYFLTVDCFH